MFAAATCRAATANLRTWAACKVPDSPIRFPSQRRVYSIASRADRILSSTDASEECVYNRRSHSRSVRLQTCAESAPGTDRLRLLVADWRTQLAAVLLAAVALRALFFVGYGL